MTKLPEKECRQKHKDHWEYVDESQDWCPICKAMR